MMINLTGITWNHPRGYEPLIAVSEAFTILNPDTSVSWDVRSLKEFGDVPIEELVNNYDLITIDHPYMGQADKNKLLLPLEKYISSGHLRGLSRQSVGSSFSSYQYNGHLYALPVDSAALVSAYRNDFLTKFNLSLPQTRAELKRFYRKVPQGFEVAWPLCSTDLWCSFLSICAQDGGSDYITDFKFNEKICSKVIDELKFHLEFIHPESINWNPIQILDKMGNENKIIYSPYLFGYSNYSRLGYSQYIVNFSNSPLNPGNDVSTIMGGVGLAVSSRCKNVTPAMKYLKYITSTTIQEKIYTPNGGQPGNLKAWKSKKNNIICHDFFNNTIKTLVHAYVRPQHPGWNIFQELGASLLHQSIIQNIRSEKVMKDLNQLYQSVAYHE